MERSRNQRTAIELVMSSSRELVVVLVRSWLSWRGARIFAYRFVSGNFTTAARHLSASLTGFSSYFVKLLSPIPYIILSSNQYKLNNKKQGYRTIEAL